MTTHKLTPAQLSVLELLVKGGTLAYWHGGVGASRAFVTLSNGMSHKISSSTAFALSRTLYLDVKDKDWRRTIYVISDAGREILK